MKKFITSFVFTIIFTGYVLYQNIGSSSVSYVASSAKNSIPTTNRTPIVPVAIKNKPSGQYNDGTYTGNSADAYYGLVKVRVIIFNGRITDVEFLDHPGDRDTSRYINGLAMPILKTEALQAQSAKVDTVSGATATSGAFRESLAIALSQAKI